MKDNIKTLIFCLFGLSLVGFGQKVKPKNISEITFKKTLNITKEGEDELENMKLLMMESLSKLESKNKKS